MLHPCAPVRWLCVWSAYMSRLLRPCLLSWDSPSTCSLHPPAVAALWDTEAHRAQTEPLFAWPCSIPPTTLITSQMVIDEASLAALTPLKDSQTYIRGATDRSELPPSKAGLHRELGAPDLLITPAVPRCCPPHRLHRADSSSRITTTIFQHACPQTRAKLQRRIKSIIQ